MIRRGQLRLDSGSLNDIDDLPAVSRNYYAIDIACGARAFGDPANHRFSGNFDEGFSWQTARCEAGWNNGNRAIHGVTA
jgi:hypothetical protein